MTEVKGEKETRKRNKRKLATSENGHIAKSRHRYKKKKNVQKETKENVINKFCKRISEQRSHSQFFY